MLQNILSIITYSTWLQVSIYENYEVSSQHTTQPPLRNPYADILHLREQRNPSIWSWRHCSSLSCSKRLIFREAVSKTSFWLDLVIEIIIKNDDWHNDWLHTGGGNPTLRLKHMAPASISRSINFLPHAFMIQQPTGVTGKPSYPLYCCWVRSCWDYFPNPPQKQCSNPSTFSSCPSSRIHPGAFRGPAAKGNSLKTRWKRDHKACTIRACTVAVCTTEPYKFFWRLFGPDSTYHHSVLNTLRQEEKYERSSVCACVYQRDYKTRPEAQAEREGEKDRQNSVSETIFDIFIDFIISPFTCHDIFVIICLMYNAMIIL